MSLDFNYQGPDIKKQKKPINQSNYGILEAIQQISQG